MIRDAAISASGLYRYRLVRIWDRSGPCMLFIMLNPSTADALMDDATVRSCIRLAKHMGYGGIEIVNTQAYRATNPDDLLLLYPDTAVGPDNDHAILGAMYLCTTVVAAWGAHKSATPYEAHIRSLAKERGRSLWCFGKTKSGAPKHPLYLKTGTPLEAY